jgi:5'-3' exonuclease
MSKLAIIDGDVLCYHACRPRWEITARKVGDRSVVALDDNGKRIPLEYTKEDDQKYLMDSWENLKKDLVKLMDKVYCDHYLMAVKSPTNYRADMYPEYKLNRHIDPSLQNKFVPVLRKLAVLEELAIEATGREADDLLRMWAEQAREAGDPYVICSIDKDLRCIPGEHYIMDKRNEFLTIDDATACRFYYEQLLKGDPTDNIPGVRGVGDKTATKILRPYTTVSEFQEQIVDQYMQAYGDEWKDMLLSNAKMIHLQKHTDDYFSFHDWPIIQEVG